jgi:hypothetical protein
MEGIDNRVGCLVRKQQMGWQTGTKCPVCAEHEHWMVTISFHMLKTCKAVELLRNIIWPRLVQLAK